MLQTRVLLFMVIFLLSGLVAGKSSKRSDGRITFGVQIDIHHAPYQVSFQYLGGHFCGASIIGSKWVLSAGHCAFSVKFISIAQLSIRAGSSRTDSGGTTHPIRSVHIHPNFDRRTIDYDVSVISVSEVFVQSRTTRTVPLAPANYRIPAGEMLVVTGWGKTSENAVKISPVLRLIKMSAVRRSECKDSLDSRSMLLRTGITPRMFCAGGHSRDACQGDSGGPVVNLKGLQVGIVSWGRGCGREHLPGAYTSIPNSQIRNFIKRTSGI